LSNELFALFLDDTMTYSAALFGTGPDGTPIAADGLLTQAQHRKIDRLLDRAHVGPGSRLLEIGTGWGELAIRAGQRGATVRTVTLPGPPRQDPAPAARPGGPPRGRGRARRAGHGGTARLPGRNRRVRRHLLGRDDR